MSKINIGHILQAPLWKWLYRRACLLFQEKLENGIQEKKKKINIRALLDQNKGPSSLTSYSSQKPNRCLRKLTDNRIFASCCHSLAFDIQR